MKILLISPIAPPAGGIATWTKEYLDSEYAKKNEIKLINIAVSGKRIKERNRFNFFEEFRRVKNILKNLRITITNNNFDIVHINSSCSKFGLIRELLCVKMIKKRNIKIVIHFHCDVSYMIKSKIQKIILQKILAKVDKIIVLNEVSLKYIKRICSNHMIYVLPNFINSSIIQKENMKISENIKKIIFVGRVCKQKGCNNIMEVADKFPDKEFKFIGKIEEDYSKTYVPENIKMLGEIENVIDELKKSDLFLFPTYTEGFPCALLEAMAVGLPVIATNVGAIPDMIEDQGGIYCRVDNSEDIIVAIKKLQGNKRIRERMSKWNKKKVKEEYLKENVLRSLFKIYEEE